jgi:cyanophycinase-like exopeptidase
MAKTNMQALSRPSNQLKPLFLLADSQLLFFKENGKPYINRLLNLFDPGQSLTAAYIGASNGDEPQFYDIFTQAMAAISITNCRHITSDLTPSNLDFISNAQIILLAGGNINLGWQTLNKIAPQLNMARHNGAVLIGTSAGAIQMGQLGWHDKPQLSNTDIFSTLGYIPAIFGAHEEQQNWHQLRQVVSQTAGVFPGIGIQSGAGLMVTPDNQIQSIGKPLIHLSVKENQLMQQSLSQLMLG